MPPYPAGGPDERERGHRGGCRFIPAALAAEGADRGLELMDVEGFGENPGHATWPRIVLLKSLTGDEEDGWMGLSGSLQRVYDAEAIAIRQMHVEQDEVESFRLKAADGLVAGIDELNAVSIAGQHAADEPRDHGFILGEEYAHGWHYSPATSSARSVRGNVTAIER